MPFLSASLERRRGDNFNRLDNESDQEWFLSSSAWLAALQESNQRNLIWHRGSAGFHWDVMVLFLRLVGIAAVGAAAWIFMRPRTPFLPPTPVEKKRRVSLTGPGEEDVLEDLPPVKVHKRPLVTPLIDILCF